MSDSSDVELSVPVSKGKLPDRVEKDMSVAEVLSFLQRRGIPEEFCKEFESNYIDGEEFITLTEAEVRRMVPPIGLARKILRLIPPSQEQQPTEPLNLPSESGQSAFHLPKHLVPPTPSSSQLNPETEQNYSPVSRPSSPCLSTISSTSTPLSGETKQIIIPNHWRPEVEQCIMDKCITINARNEIVRTLVNQLFARSNKPSRVHCDELARKLILKYPFAKDDLGNGYQSWSDKMVERIRNVIKRDRKSSRGSSSLMQAESESKAKRTKKESELLRRYPVSSTSAVEVEENPETLEKHKKAITTELAKAKPRETVLLPLMKSTYSERRMLILHHENSVQDILSIYPALSRPAIIDQEMILIFGDNSIKADFYSRWTSKYVPAVLTYAERGTKKKLSNHLANLDEADDTSKQLTAMKVLAECLGKGQSSLCCLYEEYMAMEGIENALKRPPVRMQPRIGAVIGDDNVEYLIICEQKVICKQATLQAALFTTIAAYYCFNLEYPSVAKNMFNFFQDYILDRPDSTKKTGAYLGTVSDIKRCL